MRIYIFTCSMVLMFVSTAHAKIDFAKEGYSTHAEIIQDCRAALNEAKSGNTQYMRSACMAQILGFWDGYLAFTEYARSITRIKDSCTAQRDKFYHEVRNRANIPDAFMKREVPLQVSLLEKAVKNMDAMLDARPVEKRQEFLKEYNEFSLPALQQHFTKDSTESSADHALQLPFPTLNALHATCAEELGSLKNSQKITDSYCLNYIQGMATGYVYGGWMIPVAPTVECTESQFVAEIAEISKLQQCPVHRVKTTVTNAWKQFESNQPEPLHDGVRSSKLVEFLVTLGNQHSEVLQLRGPDGKLLTVNSAVKDSIEDNSTLCVPESPAHARE